MPEISLKAYFGKLNALLSAHAADEVIHHARHILQSYPKNVTAYRFLGRALVLNGRWQEGRETLRRVLSVYPDDYVAHLGLSEANEHLNRPDEAIWHLERAYEQNTNNKEIIEALRGLYRRYRNIENLKIQLTAAAVARQNVRSGNYTQAIDTLRSARARMNDRLDLKLLLAQTLWDQGSHEEAAEIAVEVLKVLPDCLEANRIMAQLWLSLGLPSDAQRYVNHLENVDPYLAVEVVQGVPADEEIFRLEELDYVHTAQSELANARPDWLQDISAAPMAADAAKDTARDDWSSWTSVLLGNQSPAPAAPVQDEEISETPMSERFAALSPQPEPVIHTEGLTDLFGAVDDAPVDDLAALFEASHPSPSTDSLDERDPMAWLRSAGIETVDDDDEEPSFESLFAQEEDGPLPEMDANPMAWLEDSNRELILEQDRQTPDLSDDEPVFDWMQESSASAAPDHFAPAPQAETADAAEESFAWLQDDHLLDEALSLEGHLSGDAGAPQSRDFFSETPPTILDGQDDDMLVPNESFTASSAETESGVPGARRGLTAILSDAKFDWLNDSNPDADAGNEGLEDWHSQFGASPRQSPTDTPDWLTDLDADETGAPEAEPWNPDEPGFFPAVAQANADAFARMSSGSDEDAENFEDEDDDADWLAEFSPEDEAEEAPAAENEAEAADTGALPDWLTDFIPADTQDGAPQPAVLVEEVASWTPSAPAEENALSDWLSDLSPEDDAQAQDDAESEFSWTGAPAYEDAAASEETDWLAQLETPAGEGAVPASGTGISAAPADDTLPDYPWMRDDADAGQAQPEGEAEAKVDTGALPEWLAEMETASANAHAAVEAEYTWMSEDSPPDQVEEAVPAASEEMDWLSELAPVAETPATPVSATGEEDYTWMSDDAIAEAEAVADDDEDWLAEFAPEAETPAASADWLTELTPSAEAETPPEPVSSEDADWLTELAFAGDSPAEAADAVPAAAGDDMDWLSELEPEDEAEAAAPVASEDAAWLSELAPAASAEPEAVSAESASADDIGWLSELAPVEDNPTPVSAAEDYTWMQQEADAEPEPVTGEPVASEDLGWLSELEPEDDEAAALEPEPALEGEDLAWLAADELADDEAAPAEPLTVEWQPEPAPESEAVAAWLTADERADEDEDFESMPVMEEDAIASGNEADAEPEEEDQYESVFAEVEDESFEPAPARNAPDWLNAMVPGLDVDYDADDAEWSEDDESAFDASEREYAWVDQIVEEELAAVEYSGYSFTRPPSWLGSLMPPQGGGGADDDLPDWISDDADADVPSWLR